MKSTTASSRSPLGAWALTLITLAQFAPIWLFLIAQDVDKLGFSRGRSYRKYATMLVAIWVCYLVSGFSLLFLDVNEGLEATYIDSGFMLLTWIGWGILCGFIWLQVSLEAAIRQHGGRPLRWIVLIPLSLLYMISLALLQKRLNELIHRPPSEKIENREAQESKK